MLKLSKDSFALAGKQWVESVRHLASGGAQGVETASCVLSAAEKTLEAAVLLGNAGVLKAAQASVVVAREALMAVEKGADGAGSLLQKAGQAVINAGNAVNTLASNDTGACVQAAGG